MAKQYCILNKLLSLTKRYQSRESKVSFLAKNDNSNFKMTTMKFFTLSEDHFKLLSSLPVQMISSTMALNMRKNGILSPIDIIMNTFSAIFFLVANQIYENSKLKSCINASLVLTGYFLRLCLTMTSGPHKVTLVLR